MKSRWVALLAIFMLLFGCIDNILGQNPAPLPKDFPSGNGPLSVAPVQKQQDTQQEIPPPPPSESQLPPAPPAQNNPAPAVPAKPAPLISKTALLDFGQGFDFGEGSVWLDDVADHQSQLAFLTAKFPNGEIAKKQVQTFESSYLPYASPSGRNFWIYVSQVGSGYGIDVKWAKIAVVEARDDGKRFQRSLYSDILGNESIRALASAQALGNQIERSPINKSESIDAGVLRVTLDELSHYPESNNPALVSIYGSGGALLDKAKIPAGYAYALTASDGKKYAVYYGGGGVGKLSGLHYADLGVYAAGSASLSPGTLYRIIAPQQNRTTGRYVGQFSLPGEISQPTDREFSLRMKDYWQPTAFVSTVLLEIIDEDGYVTNAGVATKAEPFLLKDKYGRSYSAWLDEISSSQAKVTLYRE